MKKFCHEECIGVRGIKNFKCTVCGKDSSNYSNGIDVCRDCCIEKNICEICGDDMNTNKNLCKYCKHESICKYKEEYEKQLSLVDVSKLEAAFILIKAYCKYFNSDYLVESVTLYEKEN